ncbi:MAG: hypothetical protein H0T89_27165 [Deltaproteobacteria bacterium]|nr:hypothetical protein [Deltaproteobacteria bacterium]MDQ3300723.1 hypothetical protein [Myxococcota bacterium]
MPFATDLALCAGTWLVASGCGGGGSSARPPVTAVATARPAADAACSPAYAEYEAKWRVALSGDLAELGDSMEPAAVEDIISGQVATLPNREELTKLRSVYAVVDLFVSDAPWPAAFTAADRAIEVCGEGAKRPARQAGTTTQPVGSSVLYSAPVVGSTSVVASL